MVALVLTTAMEPLTAMIFTFNHHPDFRPRGSCSDLLASKTHVLLHEGQEEQTSSVQQDLGGCLLVVVLQDESA